MPRSVDSTTSFIRNFSSFKMSESQVLTHPTIKDGWFHEISDTMWPGQAMALRVEKILFAGKSKYQDVLVFKSTDYGNVLVLDNVIQVTERDEHAYQEMITHLAIASHPKKQGLNVLVVGGGDGGVLREVLKYGDAIEQATLCDIDEMVIDVSKKYLPGLSNGAYDHPKVKTYIGDGFEFLKTYENTFDVIITDSSDPEGPAESLFQEHYFKLLNNSLKEDGIITTQAENIWLHMPIIKKLKETCSKIFPVVQYGYTTIPTYPSGQIGFMVCSKGKTVDVTKPTKKFTKEEEKKLFKYYNSEIHEAAFVLPTFAAVELN
ncbi:spermidine synthase [Saccharomycopsis crataegensis]|uniref:Spermidine synthase n=1 Tax=Saccharomycopsis crataegensis TaxID=43959 RepID=A0AAV5QH10_9ASCO|nr:spermidine synthase [Saccharomycopsis crataegensis]